jgi:hypothetical protein
VISTAGFHFPDAHGTAYAAPLGAQRGRQARWPGRTQSGLSRNGSPSC